MLGIDFPLVAFSHCRDVVASVSRAGGFGMLGVTGFTPDELERELRWIDEHIDGKPYGVDVLIPENLSIKDERGVSTRDLAERIPEKHKDFVRSLLERHDVPPPPPRVGLRDMAPSVTQDEALKRLDVAFRHPVRLIANALGVPPKEMIDLGRKHGVPVAALVGAKEHAVRQVEAGVDLIVAQGSEAGGHTGEVATLVLVPEVVRAVKAIRDVPVLAAGGIMTGRQMAACMVMGAAGAWTGSVWLATTESETTEIFRQKMIGARSRDTVRSKCRTGKYTRQLRSAWTDAWEGPGGIEALPMPLQSMLSEPALRAADRAAELGNRKARELVTYFVGQGVGLVDGVRSSREVVKDFMEEFADALGDVERLLEDS
jgi:NAD(P)H-dependent flavin oxidoreductase YrpB (nitropropane dioxygenase family)